MQCKLGVNQIRLNATAKLKLTAVFQKKDTTISKYIPFNLSNSKLTRLSITVITFNFQRDLKKREKRCIFGLLSVLCCFYCVFISHLFNSAVKPQQLWQIITSCQHFDLIVGCVNQAQPRCTKSDSSHSLFQLPLRSFLEELTLTVSKNHKDPE